MAGSVLVSPRSWSDREQKSEAKMGVCRPCYLPNSTVAWVAIVPGSFIEQIAITLGVVSDII